MKTAFFLESSMDWVLHCCGHYALWICALIPALLPSLQPFISTRFLHCPPPLCAALHSSITNQFMDFHRTDTHRLTWLSTCHLLTLYTSHLLHLWCLYFLSLSFIILSLSHAIVAAMLWSVIICTKYCCLRLAVRTFWFVFSHSPHFGLFFSLLTLAPLFIPSFCQKASFLKALNMKQHTISLSSLFRLSVLYTFLYLSFFSCMLPVFPILFFLCLVFFMFFLCLFSPLIYSSLLLNIWLWVHWHDTTVPCCSWGCLDPKAQDEGNMQHFQTYTEPFLS